MSLSFNVKMSNFSGSGLIACDRSGTSDPFLKITFDSTKHFQTEVIKKTLEPQWKFENEFTYDTYTPERLNSKYFKIECWDWNKVEKAELMGSFSMNLWNIATGPKHIDHLLRLRGKPAGRISLDIEMIQKSDVIMNFEEVNVFDVLGKNQNGTSDICIEYNFSTNPDQKQKTDTIRGVNQGTWQDSPKLFFSSSLKELIDGNLYIQLLHDSHQNPSVIGDCEYNFKITELNEETEVEIETDFYMSGNITGKLKGKLKVLNIPEFYQMIGGKSTEFGVSGGVPILEFSHVPENYPKKGLGGPPKVAKTRTRMTRPSNTQNTQIIEKEINVKPNLDFHNLQLPIFQIKEYNHKQMDKLGIKWEIHYLIQWDLEHFHQINQINSINQINLINQINSINQNQFNQPNEFNQQNELNQQNESNDDYANINDDELEREFQMYQQVEQENENETNEVNQENALDKEFDMYQPIDQENVNESNQFNSNPNLNQFNSNPNLNQFNSNPNLNQFNSNPNLNQFNSNQTQINSNTTANQFNSNPTQINSNTTQNQFNPLNQFTPYNQFNQQKQINPFSPFNNQNQTQNQTQTQTQNQNQNQNKNQNQNQNQSEWGQVFLNLNPNFGQPNKFDSPPNFTQTNWIPGFNSPSYSQNTSQQWIQQQDPFGRPFWKNSITGAITFINPGKF
ncbi:tricalbin-1-related [Anaeramoeba ignava]|uniref:Tricalbin-1-related n=1 Tax=Anaeramoeba ignava TaxID=1746090 RepID=A0A9Q0LXU6_ANAIG|nr:tricalbin-1-related [Anaeramoeba ignava]